MLGLLYNLKVPDLIGVTKGDHGQCITLRHATCAPAPSPSTLRFSFGGVPYVASLTTQGRAAVTLCNLLLLES